MSEPAEMSDIGWDVDYVFYRDRPEWEDVTPIPQEEGPNPVVKIAYSERFIDVFGYFRAVVASKEFSERAFKLTEDAISVNPNNYTVWNYRRMIFMKLEKDFDEEFEYISQIIEDHPKSYQAWHHRLLLVEWSLDSSREKKFTERILADDPKNYHTWQHRQWFLSKFELWEGELAYVEHLLEDDIRNNSAWNQRYFTISSTTGFTDEVIERELAYTLKSIKKAPNNESPWNYLRGVLQDKGLTTYQNVTDFTNDLYESGCRSPHLLGFIIDLMEEKLLAEKDEGLLTKAIELCMDLSMTHDRIRCEYWRFIARELNQLYKESSEVKNSDSDQSINADNDSSPTDRETQ